MLPSDFPPWQSVYTCFSQWRDDCAWRRLHDTLSLRVRHRSGRHKHRYGWQYQIVRQSRQASTPVCYPRHADSRKRITGRKRHLLVDTPGLTLAVLVIAATCLTAMGHGNCSDEAAVSAGNCVSSGLTAPIAALCRDGLRSLSLSPTTCPPPARAEVFTPCLPRQLGGGAHLRLPWPQIVASAKTMNDCPQAVSGSSLSL